MTPLRPSDVARFKGCSRLQVSRAIGEGDLKAEWTGRGWAVDAESVAHWEPRRGGRRKKRIPPTSPLEAFADRKAEEIKGVAGEPKPATVDKGQWVYVGTGWQWRP